MTAHQSTEPPETQRSHSPAESVRSGLLSQRCHLLELPNSTQGQAVAATDEKEKRDEDEKKATWTRLSDWFVWKMLAVILSAVTLIALVVVLAKFDGMPQPTWEHVSLNTGISWLSTVSKACIIFAVSEALGQLKWVSFAQKTQPMVNLRTFDSASRGIYGSAELIWTLRCRHFAIWGGLAVILALGFDPFTQNLICYYPQMVEDASQRALLANVSSYVMTGPTILRGAYFWGEPLFKANVYNSSSKTTSPDRGLSRSMHAAPATVPGIPLLR